MEWRAEPDQKLSIDGVDLEYMCHGPPPGHSPTIVMLHEGLGCVALWRDVPERLAKATGLGVLVYSRPGYGRSDPAELPFPPDYLTHEATGTLARVMDAAGLGDVILMGHSDGASIAAIYAGSVSDRRVRGLVLIAPHFFVEPEGLKAIRAAQIAFSSGKLKEKLTRYHAQVESVFYGWHDVWTSSAFQDWNVADAIDHWRIPVLAIQGREDPYGTLAQIDEMEARIYAPLEILILKECGHAPHLEHPHVTDQAIVQFCARLIRLEQQDVALA